MNCIKLRSIKLLCAAISAGYAVISAFFSLLSGLAFDTIAPDIFTGEHARQAIMCFIIPPVLSSLLFCIIVIVVYNAVVKPYILSLESMRSARYRDTEMLAKRYQIVAEYAGSIIFDYSIPDSRITFNDNFSALFGYTPPDTVNDRMIISQEHIHPDDIEGYRSFCKTAAEIPGGHSVEIRLKNKDGGFHWCLIELTALNDNSVAPERIIGRISDISKQKSQLEEMEYKAQIDQLTGFYNKLSAMHIISGIFADSGSGALHAVMIFDIDDFKEINDSFGHLYGDLVIAECADRLRGSLRKSDVLCRFGGDEYVVLMKDIPSREFALRKSQEIIEHLSFPFNDARNSCQVSMSAGLSFYPEHGTDYETLYEKSDQALYYSKRTGKRRKSVYNDDIGEMFTAYSADTH